MKILVLSDSHGSVDTMLAAVEREKPQAIIHLGDMWADGRALHRALPEIPFYQVEGNCDRYSWEPCRDTTIIQMFDGVTCYMTHGHLHGVKTGLLRLALAAQEAGAGVALFGHTHSSLCTEQNGVLLVNPGSCKFQSGSYAVLNLVQGTACCELKKLNVQ